MFTLAHCSVLVEPDAYDRGGGRRSPVGGSQLPERWRAGEPFVTLSRRGFCSSFTATYTVLFPLEEPCGYFAGAATALRLNGVKQTMYRELDRLPLV
jgi:hypothetical protein